jgi:hypothetical protein
LIAASGGFYIPMSAGFSASDWKEAATSARYPVTVHAPSSSRRCSLFFYLKKKKTAQKRPGSF